MPFEPIYIIYGAVFLGVILAVEGVVLLLTDLSRGPELTPNRRLRMLAAGQTREEVMVQLRRERRAPADSGNPVDWFIGLATQAGIRRPPRQIAFLMLAATVLLLLILLGMGKPAYLTLPVALVVGVLLPIAVLMLKRRARLKRFAKQLPDAIDVVVRSLKAGHPVPTALGLVAREMADPIGTEFGLAVDEMTYGLNLDEALLNMARRVGSSDLQFMVVAVMIQLEVGGNLAEVLSGLSRIIRERFRMRAKARALSAEGRFSAWVLTVLPFVMILVISALRPGYYTDPLVMHDPIFWPAFGGGFVLMVLGSIIMYRMVNFRV
jgi:tight adherence protein B